MTAELIGGNPLAGTVNFRPVVFGSPFHRPRRGDRVEVLEGGTNRIVMTGTLQDMRIVYLHVQKHRVETITVIELR